MTTMHVTHTHRNGMIKTKNLQALIPLPSSELEPRGLPFG